MSEPKLVWVGKDFQEPIRGQEASMFWDSRGSKITRARAVLIVSCGKCGRGMSNNKRGGTDGWPKECDNCGWVNYAP